MSDTNTGQNDNRFDTLMDEVQKLGEEAAMGKDSLPKLALRVVRASADRVIETYDPKKHNAKHPDDAHKIYEAYVQAEGRKAIHEHTANGKKANVSKLRQLINVGAMTTVDAVEVYNRATVLHHAMAVAEDKIKPAYAAFVDLAREQLDPANSDNELTDEAIRDVFKKPDPTEKTVARELSRIEKAMNKLLTGDGGVKCQEQKLIDAHSLVQELCTMVTAQTELATAQAKIAALEADAVKTGNVEITA